MGSSGGSSDFEEPPRGPNPPAGSIIPQGGSAPLKSNFINFLGDTNTPSTGLTPEMLDAIMATQSPSPGPPGMGMGGPPAAAAAPPPASREKLAQVMSGRGEGGSRGGRGAGSGGNSGGWGGH